MSLWQPPDHGTSEIDPKPEYTNVSDLGAADANLDMNGNNITGIGGLNGCANDEYVDGQGDCEPPGGQTETLAETLTAGNVANQSIDMSGNNLETGGGTVSIEDTSNNQFVANFSEGGNVVIPSGNLTVEKYLNPDGSLKIGGSVDQEVTTNPSIASSISSASLDGSLYMDVSGGYAYLTPESKDSLVVIDVSNPNDVSIVGSVTDATNLDRSVAVEVTGNYAYVLSLSADRLTVVDISDKSNPTVIGSVSSASELTGPEGLAVSGKYAYVAATDADQLTVVDVSDPANPKVVGAAGSSIDTEGAAEVEVSGDYAYLVANKASSLTVIDISDPSNPAKLGTVSDSFSMEFPVDVSVSGGFAYVASFSSDSLTVVDVSDPNNPSIMINKTESFMDGAAGVETTGDYAYITSRSGNSLTVFDVSSPANPKIIANLTDTELNGADGLEISGGHAYVAAFWVDRFTAVDITSVDAPAASIGHIQAGDLHVTDDITVGQDLKVESGLNVGPRGIKADGVVQGKDLITTGDINMSGALYGGLSAVDIGTNLDMNGNNITDSAKGNVTVGQDLKVYGDLWLGSADLAEAYRAEDDVGKAEIVMTGSSGKSVRTASETGRSKILGVVSTEPALTLNSGENGVRVALVGRVPVKVNLENGPIEIGDPVTISSTPGMGMKAEEPGMVVGIALEQFNQSSDSVRISVFVNPRYHVEQGMVESLREENQRQDKEIDQLTDLVCQDYPNASVCS